MSTTARVGLDIGGTFTDVVLETADQRFTAKVLTTPAAPEVGAMEALEVILRQSGLPASAVTELIHGTTLATNALIERKGARTALLTTEGFRDTLEIGTEGRPDQYDTQLVKPEPLVPRRLRFPVRERLDARGDVLIALDEEAVRRIARELRQQGVESVAIGFMHSYVDDRHEQLAARILREELPGVDITLSAEVSPEFREFERFSTACANAYIQPLMARYLGPGLLGLGITALIAGFMSGMAGNAVRPETRRICSSCSRPNRISTPCRARSRVPSSTLR